MKPIRVLQTSDWHIGRLPFQLRTDRGIQRQDFLLQLLEQLPEFAKNQNVDIVLLPGDLFNADSIPSQLIERFFGILNAFAPIPVIISTGNHDYYDSFLSLVKRFNFKKQEASVLGNHVYLAGKEWQRFQFQGFAVTARSFLSLREMGALQKIPPRGLDPVEILCFHGSVGEVPPEQEPMATISPDELLGMNYDYAAIGHYHRRKFFLKNDRVVAGYSGAFLAQRKSDVGDLGFLILDVEPKGVFIHNIRAENWDKLRIHEITLSFPGDGEPIQALENKWRELNIQLTDYVRVIYQGRLSKDRFRIPNPDHYKDRCYHLENIIQLTPDWDYEELAKGISAEAQFVRTQLERIQEAIRSQNKEEEQLQRDILEVGLQAFRYQKVEDKLPARYST
ncbi:MAG: metallophosphoesterase [bacterium]|nr:metallophosphoesterase [bacterium]